MGGRVASIGECMVEVVDRPDGSCLFGFGGDTLNTAVYLARLGAAVDYVTALGDDPFSERMLRAWGSEGVGTGLVERKAGRLPGLYVIRTDEAGERRFYYWRDRAPARELFEEGGAECLAGPLSGCAIVYLSGISLSLYGEAGRPRLFALLDRLRAGGTRIAFDSNYRPRGWRDPEEARGAFAAMLSRTDLALSTFEDEALIFGDADALAAHRRQRAAGVAEVVVKQGAEGAVVDGPDGAVRVPVEEAVRVVDTTAAGDSFNAAYMAARLAGLDPARAARIGHKVAGAVVGHPGAIIPRSAMPEVSLP
jgi:2-dehydro-3-deoxygluconokinase